MSLPSFGGGERAAFVPAYFMPGTANRFVWTQRWYGAAQLSYAFPQNGDDQPLGRSSRGSTSMSKKQVSPGMLSGVQSMQSMLYRPGSDGITTVVEINFGP